MKSHNKKVVVLAQTPPPFHGQAVMQQYLVEADWKWCSKEHIRLDYSDSIEKVGHFQFSKIGKLIGVLKKIRKASHGGRIDLLYYPPAGPNRIPLYRDIVTLLFARKFARKIVLHFHAGGLADLIPKLTRLERSLARRAFDRADAAIVLLPWLEKEVTWFNPKKTLVIPNGIKDVAHQYPELKEVNAENTATKILFVGNLKAEKGLFVLIEAVAKLKIRNPNVTLRVMGEAHSPEIRESILAFIKDHGVHENIVLLGSVTGHAKWREFATADIFCLPTFATEAMPVSILEAMMFSLPVVTTNWRGIPDMIENQSEGLLTEIGNAEQLAEQLACLATDPSLRSTLGKKARERFEKQYSIEHHLFEMEETFRTL